MAEIDVDLSGMQAFQERLDNLREDFEDEPVYVVGTNVEYGVFLEFGTEDMPPYPWFRPAVREFRRNPEGFLLNNTDLTTIDEIESTNELIRSVAAALQGRMEDNVNAQDPTGDRSPGTDPEHPKRDSGNLTASIQSVRIR